jgi:hypothetical protein
MLMFNGIGSRFNWSANVGNPILVLLIVITGILKPAGAIMV